MKTNTLIGLLLFCAILAGVAYLMLGQSSEPPKSKMGEKLFETLPINEVAAITIKSREGSVRLKKSESIWVVETRSGYAANFSMITDLLRKIKDLKAQRSFKSSDDTISRLALADPERSQTPDDQKAVRLILEAKDNRTLADLMIGKEKEGAEGSYLMRTGESLVYIADKGFRELNKKPAEWLDKELLKLKPEDIEQVICRNPDSQKPVYTLKRPEKGKDAELIDLPAGKKTVKHKLHNVISAIAPLQIEDIADPSAEAVQKGFDQGKYFEYRLFDGTIYKLYPGKPVENDPEKFYCKLSVSYEAPPIKSEPERTLLPPIPETKPEDSATSTTTVPPSPEELLKQQQEKEKQEAAQRERLAAEAEELNQKLRAWVYMIPKWKRENLITNMDDLFEQDPPKPPAKTTNK